MEILTGIEERFKRLRGVLDERSRRLLVAAESEAVGPRGISTVSKATGVSRQVIRQGIAELKESRAYAKGVKVSDQEIAQLNLHRDQFHGEWNYEIRPRKS